METVTSIFESRDAGERAFAELVKSAEFDRENLLLLTPDGAAEKIDAIPTDDGEQPGMGSAIGGLVGGAVGLAAFATSKRRITAARKKISTRKKKIYRVGLIDAEVVGARSVKNWSHADLFGA